MRLTSVR